MTSSSAHQVKLLEEYLRKFCPSNEKAIRVNICRSTALKFTRFKVRGGPLYIGEFEIIPMRKSAKQRARDIAAAPEGAGEGTTIDLEQLIATLEAAAK